MSLILHIARHAKASSQDYFPGDFYRTLDKDGYSEGAAIAARFVAVKERPTLIVTSPAIRAYSTALLFADRLAYPMSRIELNFSVYDALASTLLNVVREWHHENKNVMLFGHNPGVTDLVNYLCGPVEFGMATAQIVSIDINCGSWSEVQENSGKVVQSIKP